MSPQSTRSLPSVSPLFAQKKAVILNDLGVPEASYTDLSPKGSVDAGIRDLIDRINKIEGIVTTSSCAGRISVFLEGLKSQDLRDNASLRFVNTRDLVDANGNEESDTRQALVPGGKGKGGRWLFVSHDPVDVPVQQDSADTPVSKMFKLSPLTDVRSLPGPNGRFAKFQFEPMILHIMTASLYHAQLILSAAINAGFRESGVQSLKSLDDPSAFPMVAVRTSGLALSSLVGFMIPDSSGSEAVQSMVDEVHLKTLLNLGNARFEANAERISRLEGNLFGRRQDLDSSWEDPKSRQERKRAEGLREKERVQKQRSQRDKEPRLGDLTNET